MSSFLSALAQTLYDKYGDDIHKLTIVFPSRRARYYFSQSLARLISRPIWQPRFVGMDEFIHKSSQLRVTDNYQLIVELYRVFTQVKQTNESFDQFYFWGEALLNDFDAIDKYLVDASQMFRNLADEKVFTEDLSFLTEEQQAVITHFWESFSVSNKASEAKGKFLSVWEALLPIYSRFSETLKSKGLAYSGMVYRDVAERLLSGEEIFADAENIVFAGFNALNKCEKTLFAHLHKRGAAFYYDYDNYYVKNLEQEAGLFLRSNLSDFPEPQNLNSESLFVNGEKNIDVIATPSDSLQAKQAAQIAIDMVGGGAKAERTAIVFTNENLLVPVLSAVSSDAGLPSAINEVNVTMGYPLKFTPVFSLIEHVLSLYRTCRRSGGSYLFYHKDVQAILEHQLVKQLGIAECSDVSRSIKEENRIFIQQQTLAALPIIGSVFALEAADGKTISYSGFSLMLISLLEVLQSNEECASNDGSAVYAEFTNYALSSLRKLHSALCSEEMQLSQQVFASLIRKTLSSIRIPFEGFPVAGLQLMGILETRNLDFENVIVLSLNDDQFPAVAQSPSFIPYSIKRAFGMPTYEQQEAMYAYYFFRLLQRAKNIKLLYNTKADERSSGEMSRFLQQLRYESGLNINFKNIGYSLTFRTAVPIAIEKTPEVMDILSQYVDGSGRRSLSPSAISNYLTCRLKFYFNYIAGVKEDDDVEEDISSQVFGKILHEAMDVLYHSFGSGNIAEQQLLDAADDKKLLLDIIDAAFAKEFVKSEEGKSLLKMNGKFLLVREVVLNYVRGVLRYDAALVKAGSTLSMIALEDDLKAFYPFEADGETKRICFKGRLDRVDRLNGVVRIVDYKTGGYKKKNEFKSIEKMFVGDDTSKYKGAMQTFLYSLMYSIAKGEEAKNIKPSLYFVRAIHTSDFNPYLFVKENKVTEEIENFLDYKDEFVANLNPVLAELFSQTQCFDQTGDVENMCRKYCPYNEICRR